MFTHRRFQASVTCKGKGNGPGTCYSADYTSQTRDQKQFTISELAADWHELMIPRRTMRPSITSCIVRRDDYATLYRRQNCINN